MNIPNFVDAPIVDRDGKLTPIWKGILMQLISQLQVNASDEGLYVPSLPATSIASLTASTGALVYNSDTNKFMACEAGTFKTITTS